MSKIVYAESFVLNTGFRYMSNAINAAHSGAVGRMIDAGHAAREVDELSVRRNEDGSFHVNFKVYEHGKTEGQQEQSDPAASTDAG